MSVTRIAMWSGPRSISSALMRSFENREDTWVIDEPFYGYYLKVSGAQHPGCKEVIESMDCDWRQVVELLTKNRKDSLTINYQKHMTHHLFPEVQKDWLLRLKNCFLIREPVSVLASYARVRPHFTYEELGIQQQYDLFHLCAKLFGEFPPVIDANRFLADPDGMLRKVCQRLNIRFSSKMLKWPSGPRNSDGIWAKYWYDDLNKSTCFSSNLNSKEERITASRYSEMLGKSLSVYNELFKHSL